MLGGSEKERECERGRRKSGQEEAGGRSSVGEALTCCCSLALGEERLGRPAMDERPRGGIGEREEPRRRRGKEEQAGLLRLEDLLGRSRSSGGCWRVGVSQRASVASTWSSLAEVERASVRAQPRTDRTAL